MLILDAEIRHYLPEENEDSLLNDFLYEAIFQSDDKVFEE